MIARKHTKHEKAILILLTASCSSKREDREVKVLVVGATGRLGGAICERLVARGYEVRGMVRPTSNPASVERLRTLGVELVTGDLKDPMSLENACRGEEGVITTAIAFSPNRQPGDNLDTVDRGGFRSLIDTAKCEGVRRFVFTSFSGNVEESFDYKSAKRYIETYLSESGLEYVVLRPTFFMESYLDFTESPIEIYGSGEAKISWISRDDVAEFAVQALEKSSARNRVLELGGPDALSPLEVVRIFEKQTGRKFDVRHIPEEDLGFALRRHYAGGDVIPMAELLQEFPVKLTSVEDYARRVGRACQPLPPDRIDGR